MAPFQVVKARRAQGRCGGEAARLVLGPEDVVPIVLGGAKALDGGVQGDHGGSHGVAGGIGVEAAVNLTTLIQKGP